MHNVHYIVVGADSPKDACSDVENETVEWGNENNWRSICGCIDEKNKIYNTGEGRWLLKGITIQAIKDSIKNVSKNFESQSSLSVVMAKFKIDMDTLSGTDWYIMAQFCEFKQAQSYFNYKNFNIWEDEYRSWELTQIGLTNMLSSSEGKKKYIVLIDMHS